MRRDLLACGFLILIVLAFLNRGARMEGVFFGADEIASDLLHFSYPYHEFWANDYLKKGRVPLWNQYLGSGLPILAEAQTGMFYPLGIVLYLLLPTVMAFNWLIIGSFLLAAIGTYWYARELGLKGSSAFFSAVVFTLSGFMWGHLRHVPVITALAPMPVMFLATEKILRNPKKVIWASILAVATAFSVFAGHLSTSYQMILMASVYFFLRLKEDIRPVILFGVGITAAILVCAVQLVPTAELIGLSTRSGVESLTAADYRWKYLGMFLSPYIYGDPSRATWDMQAGNFWENVGYIGILPLLLVLVGLVTKGQKTVKVCLVLTLVLMLGHLTPVYKVLLDWVPGFAFTRISGRFLLFVDFFGAVLAGVGLEKVAKRKSVLVIAIALTIADLFYFGYPFNTVVPLGFFSKPKSVKFLEKDNSLFRVLTHDVNSWEVAWRRAKGWRGDLIPYMAQRELLPPDSGLLWRLPSPSIIYEAVGHFSVRRAGELDSFTSQGFFQDKLKPELARLLGMENVKYVLRDNLFEAPGLTLVNQHEGVYIYQNQQFLPRAYFVGQAKNFERADDLVAFMMSPDFDPAKQVLLENIKDINLAETQGLGTVVIDKYTDRYIMISADIQDSGYLVLSDTYYPGWKAYVDGKETKIYQANYNYRAIKLNPGQRRVEFSYDPTAYKVGKNISLVTLTGLGGLILIGCVKKIYAK